MASLALAEASWPLENISMCPELHQPGSFWKSMFQRTHPESFKVLMLELSDSRFGFLNPHLPYEKFSSRRHSCDVVLQKGTVPILF